MSLKHEQECKEKRRGKGGDKKREKEEEGNCRGGKERGRKTGKGLPLGTCRSESLFIGRFYIFLISKIRLIF